MSLFIGNPKYEDLADYDIELNQSEIPHKDDIYGVEFYGIPQGDGPTTTANQVTPYRLIKAKRLYSARNLQFRPACASINNPGIDEFFQYAGPFQLKECVMEYDATNPSKPYKFIGYKHDIMSTDSTKWSDYENTSASNKYLIMVEYPKFWYCRPSKYTFLVSTNPNRNPLPNGTDLIPWHVAPMFKRRIFASTYHLGNEELNDSTVYKEYDRCYISKYGLCSTTGPTIVSNMNRTPNAISQTQLDAFKGQRFDFAAYSSWFILLLVKYATIDFVNYIIRPKSFPSGDSKENLSNDSSNVAKILTCEQSYSQWSINNTTYKNIDYTSFPHLKNVLTDVRQVYDITNSALSSIKLLGLVQGNRLSTYQSGAAFSNGFFYLSTCLPSDIKNVTNSNLTTYAYPENLADVTDPSFTTNLAYFIYPFKFSDNSQGTGGNWYWSPKAAKYHELAYILLPENTLKTDNYTTFTYGIHSFHGVYNNTRCACSSALYSTFNSCNINNLSANNNDTAGITRLMIYDDVINRD